MKGKPIRPEDVVALKTTAIPPEVLDAFNEVIAKHWNGRSARFTQDEVLAVVQSKLPQEVHNKIFQNHWMDVEGSYREQGWSVEYDKPGYNETYDATFTFAIRKPD